MHREHRQWYSPALGRNMELLRFGHAGVPVLVFPCSMGRFYEWQDFGMVDSLAHQLENGFNQLVCVDSVDGESFYNKAADPYTRIKRHQQYEGYITGEVLPFAASLSDQKPIVAGASFGGYHAANMAFKFPDRFCKMISLSGAFDVRSFLGGFYNDDVYFSNPIDFVPNVSDGRVLDAMRATRYVFTLGEYDPCRASNEQLHQILDAKGIPHLFDFLPGAFGHDWPWWRSLIQQHIV